MVIWGLGEEGPNRGCCDSGRFGIAEFAGLEFVGLENDGLKMTDWKVTDWKITEQNKRRRTYCTR